MEQETLEKRPPCCLRVGSVWGGQQKVSPSGEPRRRGLSVLPAGMASVSAGSSAAPRR